MTNFLVGQNIEEEENRVLQHYVRPGKSIQDDDDEFRNKIKEMAIPNTKSLGPNGTQDHIILNILSSDFFMIYV